MEMDETSGKLSTEYKKQNQINKDMIIGLQTIKHGLMSKNKLN